MARNKKQKKKQVATPKQLTRESAGPTAIRSLWGSGTVASRLTPAKLAGIMQASAEGDNDAQLTLAEEMEERDLIYSSVLRTRKLAVAGVDVTVAASDSEDENAKALAEQVTKLTKQPEFGQLIIDSLDALGKGYSVHEILWDKGETRWTPRYKHRDPRFFMPHPKRPDELRIIDESDMQNGVEMPQFKFIVHTPNLKTGLMHRGGLARLAAFSYVCKMYGIKDWLGFLEIYGIPLRIGKYDNNAKPEEVEILKTAVMNLGSDAAAVMPESMQIEFQQIAQTAGASDVFARLAEFVDKQVTIAVLGQSATTEGTPGRLGNDEAQSEVRQDIVDYDSLQLANTLNRDLVKPFIDLNFGVQDEYPAIVISVPEKEDLSLMAGILEKLVPLGLPVEAKDVLRKLGLPEPKAGASLLGVTAPEAPAESEDTASNRRHVVGCQCLGCLPSARNSQQPSDETDDLVDELTKDWEQQLSPVTAPVLKAINAASSYEELIEILPTLVDDVNTKALVSKLALAGLISYGDGVEDSA